jgi:hypothetical protein
VSGERLITKPSEREAVGDAQRAITLDDALHEILLDGAAESPGILLLYEGQSVDVG